MSTTTFRPRPTSASRRATGVSAARPPSPVFGTAAAPKRPLFTMHYRRRFRAAKPSSSRACGPFATAFRRGSPRKSRRSPRRRRSTAASMTPSTSARRRRATTFNTRGTGRETAGDHARQAADRQPRRDHGARAFHGDPRPPAARRPAAPRRRRQGRRPTCGAGMRSRRSSTRASPTTPGFTRRATGRGGNAGRSRRRSCSTSPATSSSTGPRARSS